MGAWADPGTGSPVGDPRTRAAYLRASPTVGTPRRLTGTQLAVSVVAARHPARRHRSAAARGEHVAQRCRPLPGGAWFDHLRRARQSSERNQATARGIAWTQLLTWSNPVTV